MAWVRVFGVASVAGLLVVLAGPALAQQTASKPAYLTIYLPEDARLEIDGADTKQTGDTRRFVTPPLAIGGRYIYTLKMVGRPSGVETIRMQRVRVTPGEETIVDLRPGRDKSSSEIVFVPTPQPVINQMLDIAAVTKDDVVYDLGCGDGRILIAAAKKYGVRGVGVDIDPVRIKEATENRKKEKLEKFIELRQGDALEVEDIEKATVVTLYMLPEFMNRLEPILLKKLKPGTRIVSHDFTFPTWKPMKTVEIVDEDGLDHRVYFWKVEKAE